MARFAFDPYSSANQKIVDALIAGASFFAAYLTRFDGSMPPSFQLQLWLLLPFAPDFAAALVHELASFTHLPAKEAGA